MNCLLFEKHSSICGLEDVGREWSQGESQEATTGSSRSMLLACTRLLVAGNSQKWHIGKVVTAFRGRLNARMERKRGSRVNSRFRAWGTGKVWLLSPKMEKVWGRACLGD